MFISSAFAEMDYTASIAGAASCLPCHCLCECRFIFADQRRISVRFISLFCFLRIRER
jgi:hypothetical protein